MSSPKTTITRLNTEDRARWGELWQGYLTFYEATLPDGQSDETWRRIMAGENVHAYGARIDGRLVGMTHYLFHASTWCPDVCYLQDLFTDASSRGKGIGRALIEAVAADAQSRGAARLYWLTHNSNTTARLLYDRLAVDRGFIRYDYPMG